MALEIQVAWQRGHGGQPVPLSFRLGGRDRGVEEVLDRWPGPDYGYVKLRAEDGIYLLRYQNDGSDWSVVLYDSGEFPPSRLSGERRTGPGMGAGEPSIGC